MNIGLGFLPQVQGNAQSTGLDGTGAPARATGPDDQEAQDQTSDDTGWLHALNFRMGYVAQTFRQIAATVTAGYHTEHNTDDTHGVIHCTSISERSRSAAMGEWVKVPFVPSNFGTINNVTTWTVSSANVIRLAYTMVGKTMTLAFYFTGTSVGAGTASFLTMRVPGGYVSASETYNTITVIDNGTRTVGYAGVNPPSSVDTNFIYFDAGGAASGTPWSASASATRMWGQISFEVV